MNNEDTQKRMLIFFVAVSVLMFGYAIFSNYLFPSNKSENTQTQQVVEEKVNNTSIEKKVSSSNNETKENQPEVEQKTTVIHSTGSFDLLLNTQRISADDLKDVVKIENEEGYIEFSKVGGRVISIYLKRYKFDVISEFAKNNRIFPTEIITSDPNVTKLINFSKYEFSKDGKNLIFKLTKGNIQIEKIFTIKKEGDISLKVKTKGLENLNLALIDGVSLVGTGSYGHSGAIIKTKTDLIKLDSDIEREEIIRGQILWAGTENKYFMQIFANRTPLSTVHVIPVAEETTVTLTEIPTTIDGFFFGGPKLYSLLGELTAKYQKLWNVNLALRDTINFGFFGILGKPLFLLLHFFYNFIPNWGIAIILVTILIRILFFPLNHKSLKSMKKMADLAPEIEKLRKKYAKDPQKLQAEIMKLYSEAGANPMSGCLPIVVQIPVFIALYNVLMVTVELKNIPFLWIPDLSDKDPYYILPILMGLSMIAQQWITPSSDKNQKMIMYVMAGVFTFLFMNFPAGLVLYWLTNNILGIGQSFLINKQMGRYKKS